MYVGGCITSIHPPAHGSGYVFFKGTWYYFVRHDFNCNEIAVERRGQCKTSLKGKDLSLETIVGLERLHLNEQQGSGIRLILEDVRLSNMRAKRSETTRSTQISIEVNTAGTETVYCSEMSKICPLCGNIYWCNGREGRHKLHTGIYM